MTKTAYSMMEKDSKDSPFLMIMAPFLCSQSVSKRGILNVELLKVGMEARVMLDYFVLGEQIGL